MVTEISHVVDGISRYAPITSLWEEAQVCFPQFYALWPPLWNPSSHWPLITSSSLLCLWPLSPSHCPTLWSYSLWGLRPSIPPYRIHSRRHLTITMYWWVAPVSKIFPPPTRALTYPYLSHTRCLSTVCQILCQASKMQWWSKHTDHFTSRRSDSSTEL